MYRIVICDDEAPVLAALAGYLDRYAAECGATFDRQTFSSADSLLKNYPAGTDLLFLDIQMAGVDGMAAARQIRTVDEDVTIVFITSMQQYALEGYTVRAFGFLKKPVSYLQFRHELAAALRQIDATRERERFITFRERGTVGRLPVSRILYCEVRGHRVEVHLPGRTAAFRSSMKELEEQLGRYGFFRPHAAFLVNAAAIADIGAESLTLLDGAVIPLSRHRRKEFLAELSRHMGGQM